MTVYELIYELLRESQGADEKVSIDVADLSDLHGCGPDVVDSLCVTRNDHRELLIVADDS